MLCIQNTTKQGETQTSDIITEAHSHTMCNNSSLLLCSANKVSCKNVSVPFDIVLNSHHSSTHYTLCCSFLSLHYDNIQCNFSHQSTFL